MSLSKGSKRGSVLRSNSNTNTFNTSDSRNETPRPTKVRFQVNESKSSNSRIDTSDLGSETSRFETPRLIKTRLLDCNLNVCKSFNASTNTSDSRNETQRSTKVRFQVNDSKSFNSNANTSDSRNETTRSTNLRIEENDSQESGIADVSWISSFSTDRDSTFKITSTPKPYESMPRSQLRFELSSTNVKKITFSEIKSARRNSSSSLSVGSRSSLSIGDISDIANDTPEMQRRRIERLFSPEIKAKTIEKEKKKLQNELIEETNRRLNIYSMNAKEWNQQRFEDEKDTIISTLKKELIVKELTRLDRNSRPDDCINVSFLTISNIKYHITVPPTHRYYFCLLTYKTTVLASQIVSGSTSMKIKFEDDFKFTDLCNDFKVYLKLYQLNLPTVPKKLIPRLLSFLKIRRYEKLPKKFELVSVARIDVNNILMGQIRSANLMPPGKVSLSAKVTGKFGLIPKMFNAPVDFATANAKQKIFWTQKLCVLDHTALKMWTSSREEDQPDVVIDILPNIIVERTKGASCSRKRTLRITTRSNDERSSEPRFQSYLIRLATEKDCDGLLRDIELAMYVAVQNANIMVETTRRR